MSKLNKFVSTLAASDSTIKESRATILSEQASIAAEQLLSKYRLEKLSLQTKVNALTDLAPEETTSLRPGGKTFDAAKWVTELHSLKMQLKLKQIELDEMETIVTEWFGTETKSSK